MITLDVLISILPQKYEGMGEISKDKLIALMGYQTTGLINFINIKFTILVVMWKCFNELIL